MTLTLALTWALIGKLAISIVFVYYFFNVPLLLTMDGSGFGVWVFRVIIWALGLCAIALIWL